MKNLIAIIGSVVALSTPVKAETGKEMFVTLDGCQRTYVQKVLSDEGFYTSGIDGLWGKGTAKAVAQYSKGQNIEKVLKKLAKNKSCKKNPNRLRYSEFSYKKLNKSFVLIIPNYDIILNKYGDKEIALPWIREWLDENAACYGIKVENMKTEVKANMKFNMSGEFEAPSVKVTGSC